MPNESGGAVRGCSSGPAAYRRALIAAMGEGIVSKEKEIFRSGGWIFWIILGRLFCGALTFEKLFFGRFNFRKQLNLNKLYIIYRWIYYY